VHRPFGEEGEDGGADIATAGASTTAAWAASTAELGPTMRAVAGAGVWVSV
jgi:hypothetical protein